eukprot:1295510-Rhodomonas_salina.3
MQPHWTPQLDLLEEGRLVNELLCFLVSFPWTEHGVSAEIVVALRGEEDQFQQSNSNHADQESKRVLDDLMCSNVPPQSQDASWIQADLRVAFLSSYHDAFAVLPCPVLTSVMPFLGSPHPLLCPFTWSVNARASSCPGEN